MWATIEIYHKHKLKWGVELGWAKFKNSNSIICTTISSHFPSMVNNIWPSMVAMEPQRKLDLWTFDFEWQALQWTSHVEQMMTFNVTWRFPHTFWNGSVARLVMNNTLITWIFFLKNVKIKKNILQNFITKKKKEFFFPLGGT